MREVRTEAVSEAITETLAVTEPGVSLAEDAAGGMDRASWLRLGALALVMVLLYAAGRTLGLDEQLTVQGIKAQLEGAGALGLLLYFALFCVGTLVQLPGMIFLAAGVFVYGRVEGTLIAFLGAQLAMSFNFWVVRLIGGRPLALVQKPRIQRLLARLERQPVRAVILLRTFTWMSPPVNVALALSPMRYRHYALGTALGLIAPVTALSLGFDLLITRLLSS